MSEERHDFEANVGGYSCTMDGCGCLILLLVVLILFGVLQVHITL